MTGDPCLIFSFCLNVDLSGMSVLVGGHFDFCGGHFDLCGRHFDQDALAVGRIDQPPLGVTALVLARHYLAYVVSLTIAL